MLRRSDGPNLSKSPSLRLCVAILFLISRSPADQSTFVGYPSEDYRRYSVDIHSSGHSLLVPQCSSELKVQNLGKSSIQRES